MAPKIEKTNFSKMAVPQKPGAHIISYDQRQLRVGASEKNQSLPEKGLIPDGAGSKSGISKK